MAALHEGSAEVVRVQEAVCVQGVHGMALEKRFHVCEKRFEDLQEDLVCRPVIRWRGKPSLSVDLFKSSVEQGLFHAKEEPEPEPVFDVITLLAVERVSDAPPFVIRVDQFCLHVEHVLQGMADGPGYEVGLAGAVAAFPDDRFFDDRLIFLHDMLDQPVRHGRGIL